MSAVKGDALAMMLAIAFVVLAALLCGMAVIAVFGIAHLGMSDSAAVERDGLFRGTRAPRWTLPDDAGQPRCSPPASGFQLIVFGDHSLKAFPDVIAGIQELTSEDGLEIVILTRGKNSIAAPVLGMLGLGDIPVVAGSQSLYGRYNVRVTPFVIIVDQAGQVRASSLVNYEWQMQTLWKVARVPLDAPAPPLRRYASSAGLEGP
jgi:hypothetical protein